MKLRVDVSDLHGLIALGGGGLAVLCSLICLVGAVDRRGRFVPFLFFAAVCVTLWSGLFALVLRGTAVTRVAGALGLVAMGAATVLMMVASAVHLSN